MEGEEKEKLRVLLIHPHQNVMGNVLWPRMPTLQELSLLHDGTEVLQQRGYWVSFFPEGDGISFNREGAEYKNEQALADFSEAFPHIEIVEKAGAYENWGLQDLLDTQSAETIRVKYLVPVSQLLLLESFSIGSTSFHAPVDGKEVMLGQHAWGYALCDVVGADVTPSWAPKVKRNLSRPSDLLAYPLIEREIEVPAKIFHARSASVREQEKFVNFLISDADRALDLLRWVFCSFRRLEYLPNKAGWIDEFACAYVEPQFGPNKGKFFAAKPDVLHVANNWLGLEAETIPVAGVDVVAAIVDEAWSSELAPRVKAALRTIGQAYYLIEPEASFLSMLYATDALTGVGRLRGFHQRMWVAATASKGSVQAFEKVLRSFVELYDVRNSLVHRGHSFVELDLEPREVNQDMSNILCSCIEDMYEAGYRSTSEHAAQIIERLSKPEFEAVARAHPLAQQHRITFPIRGDGNFVRMLQ